MKKHETRMSSFIARGNSLIAQGKKSESIKMVENGLQYYTNRIINAISPYAKADAGLISLVLRHLADEMESNNQGAKELREGMEKIITKPKLKETEKVRKANRR